MNVKTYLRTKSESEGVFMNSLFPYLSSPPPIAISKAYNTVHKIYSTIWIIGYRRSTCMYITIFPWILFALENQAIGPKFI